MKASKIMEAAYVPYSKFKVGAAILDEDEAALAELGDLAEDQRSPIVEAACGHGVEPDPPVHRCHGGAAVAHVT